VTLDDADISASRQLDHTHTRTRGGHVKTGRLENTHDSRIKTVKTRNKNKQANKTLTRFT